MGDRAKAGAGLTVFLVLVSFPMWQVFASADGVPTPELELPAEATACVGDTEYMRTNHMDLLNRWRDSVVRQGGRDYTSESGETFTMSLTGTCLDCHANRETFCDACHDYADVEPTCWSCHVVPEGN